MSQDEHDELVDEILYRESSHRSLVRFRKRKYAKDHWDSVIVGYKELEWPTERWSSNNQQVIDRVQSYALKHLDQHVPGVDNALIWLPPHIIDLAPDGIIQPHVDSVKFSGHVVAGLSLLSTRSMRLWQEGKYGDQDAFIDMRLPPRSLYILCNEARFDLAHSIDQGSAERRISLIFRDSK